MSADQRDLSSNDDGISAIELQAADWLIQHDRGMNPAQQREFERWRLSDERHASAYTELTETWNLIGEVRAATPVAAPHTFVAGRPLRWRQPLLWLAAAASVALIFFLVQPSASPAPDFTLTASTEVGVMRKLPLPDGSSVQLNTDSAISVQFTADERRVSLVRGEAHFQVAKNPARPFIVSASGINVRAVGTAFDVRRRPGAVDVLVTEGKVRVDDSIGGKSRLTVSDANGGAYLVAGERATISVGATASPARVVAVAPVEIDQVLAWQSSQLKFVATPLAEIVAEFNRYNRHQLVIADPRLATRRFGGTFPAGDYEEFVRLLESDFGIVAERDQNEIRLKLAQ